MSASAARNIGERSGIGWKVGQLKLMGPNAVLQQQPGDRAIVETILPKTTQLSGTSSIRESRDRDSRSGSELVQTSADLAEMLQQLSPGFRNLPVGVVNLLREVPASKSWLLPDQRCDFSGNCH